MGPRAELALNPHHPPLLQLGALGPGSPLCVLSATQHLELLPPRGPSVTAPDLELQGPKLGLNKREGRWGTQRP